MRTRREQRQNLDMTATYQMKTNKYTTCRRFIIKQNKEIRCTCADVPALLEGMLGSKSWIAAPLGTAEGLKRSPTKASAIP